MTVESSSSRLDTSSNQKKTDSTSRVSEVWYSSRVASSRWFVWEPCFQPYLNLSVAIVVRDHQHDVFGLDDFNKEAVVVEVDADAEHAVTVDVRQLHLLQSLHVIHVNETIRGPLK